MQEGSRKFCEKEIRERNAENDFSENKENNNTGNSVKYKFKDVGSDETKVIFLNSKPAENDDIPSPPETTAKTTFKHYTIESYFGKPKVKTVSNVK